MLFKNIQMNAQNHVKKQQQNKTTQR